MDNDLQCVAKRFLKLELLRRCAMREICSENGLHFGQPPILRFIAEHDGCTQQEIAQALGVTAASIALSTKRLQKAGLIEKRTDQNNLRCNRLSATQNGIEASQSIHRCLIDYDKKMFSGITPQQLGELCEMLDKIILNACDGKDITFREMVMKAHEQ